MTDTAQPKPKSSTRLVTQRQLEIEDWFLNIEEFDDDDPNPPPIRGRPALNHLREVSSMRK